MYYILILWLSMVSLNTQAEEIVIGLDADMSSVAAEGGLAIQRGAQIAINEINQSGGVLGKTLRLETKDHRGNPARGVANMHAFGKRPEVLAVLGGVHTPVALSELPVIHEHGLIYLGPWAAGTPIVDNGFDPNHVFRLSVRDEHAGHVLLSYARDRQWHKVGLLLERTGWGRSNEVSMTQAAQSLGLDITAIEWFNWGEKTVAHQLARLQQSKAQVIVLVANAPEGAVVVRDMIKQPALKAIPLLSHWGIASGAFVEKAGLAAINAVDIHVLQTFSFHAPYDKTKMQAVLTQYQQQFDSTVTAETIPAAVGVAHAYDLVHLLALAIGQAKSSERLPVRAALENIANYHGLLKHYQSPFTVTKHDALSHGDYHIATYNARGFLVPEH